MIGAQFEITGTKGARELHVGDELTLELTVRVTKVEEDMIDVSSPAKRAFLPGERRVTVAICDAKRVES